MDDVSRFLRIFVPRPNAARSLVCFPHAGGSASSFRSWPHKIDEDTEVVAVQYPGREDRTAAPPIDDMDTLLNALEGELRPIIVGREFIFLGHSMGGAIAHELSLRLARHGLAPRHLVISGRQPPCHHPLDSTIHLMSDTDLLSELLRLSSENRMLAEEEELAAIFLPIVRNDYRLIERYRPAEDIDPLDCPISVLAGKDDTEMTVDQAKDWAGYTHGQCQIHVFHGDHFFIASQREHVLSVVREVLTESQAQ